MGTLRIWPNNISSLEGYPGTIYDSLSCISSFILFRVNGE